MSTTREIAVNCHDSKDEAIGQLVIGQRLRRLAASRLNHDDAAVRELAEQLDSVASRAWELEVIPGLGRVARDKESFQDCVRVIEQVDWNGESDVTDRQGWESLFLALAGGTSTDLRAWRLSPETLAQVWWNLAESVCRWEDWLQRIRDLVHASQQSEAAEKVIVVAEEQRQAIRADGHQEKAFVAILEVLQTVLSKFRNAQQRPLDREFWGNCERTKGHIDEALRNKDWPVVILKDLFSSWHPKSVRMEGPETEWPESWTVTQRARVVLVIGLLRQLDQERHGDEVDVKLDRLMVLARDLLKPIVGDDIHFIRDYPDNEDWVFEVLGESSQRIQLRSGLRVGEYVCPAIFTKPNPVSAIVDSLKNVHELLVNDDPLLAKDVQELADEIRPFSSISALLANDLVADGIRTRKLVRCIVRLNLMQTQPSAKADAIQQCLDRLQNEGVEIRPGSPSDTPAVSVSYGPIVAVQPEFRQPGAELEAQTETIVVKLPVGDDAGVVVRRAVITEISPWVSFWREHEPVVDQVGQDDPRLCKALQELIVAVGRSQPHSSGKVAETLSLLHRSKKHSAVRDLFARCAQVVQSTMKLSITPSIRDGNVSDRPTRCRRTYARRDKPVDSYITVVEFAVQPELPTLLYSGGPQFDGWKQNWYELTSIPEAIPHWEQLLDLRERLHSEKRGSESTTWKWLAEEVRHLGVDSFVERAQDWYDSDRGNIIETKWWEAILGLDLPVHPGLVNGKIRWVGGELPGSNVRWRYEDDQILGTALGRVEFATSGAGVVGEFSAGKRGDPQVDAAMALLESAASIDPEVDPAIIAFANQMIADSVPPVRGRTIQKQQIETLFVECLNAISNRRDSDSAGLIWDRARIAGRHCGLEAIPGVWNEKEWDKQLKTEFDDQLAPGHVLWQYGCRNKEGHETPAFVRVGSPDAFGGLRKAVEELTHETARQGLSQELANWPALMAYSQLAVITLGVSFIRACERQSLELPLNSPLACALQEFLNPVNGELYQPSEGETYDSQWHKATANEGTIIESVRLPGIRANGKKEFPAIVRTRES